MARRVSAIFLLLFSTLFFPFWMTAVLGVAMMAYFPQFFEAVAVFFLLDLLYGVPEVRFYGTVYAGLIASTFTLLIIEFLKRKLKYYPEH